MSRACEVVTPKRQSGHLLEFPFAIGQMHAGGRRLAFLIVNLDLQTNGLSRQNSKIPEDRKKKGCGLHAKNETTGRLA